jgi:hypothetical protein
MKRRKGVNKKEYEKPTVSLIKLNVHQTVLDTCKGSGAAVDSGPNDVGDGTCIDQAAGGLCIDFAAS